MIDAVWQGEGFYEDGTVYVHLIATATDRDARDVWCEVVGQTAIDWHLEVLIRSEMRYWPAPSRSSDPADVPGSGDFEDIVRL